MGTDILIEKIEQKSADEIAAILAEAEHNAASIKHDILTRTQEQISSLQQEASRRISEIQKRENLMANLEARKNTLSAKRAVIDLAFEQAMDALCALEEERWFDFITCLLLESCPAGGAVLRVPATDANRYHHPFSGDKNFLRVLSQQLENKHGIPCPLRLDATPGKFRGGVVILGEIRDIDLTFEALLTDLRERTEWEVSSMLFDTEEEVKWNADRTTPV